LQSHWYTIQPLEMYRFRRYVVPALLLLPLIILCGKLLLTPVWRQATEIEQLVGRDEGVHDCQDIAQIGWPSVFLEVLWWPGNSIQLYRISSWSLLADLFILLFAVAACIFVVVRHRRRRGAWFQFSLFELLAFFTIFGAVAGWCAHESIVYKRQLQAIAKLETKLGLSTEVAYCGPEWMRRLWPEDDLRIFQRPISIAADAAAPEDSTNSLPELLAELVNVNSLVIARPSRTPVASSFRVTNPTGFERIEEINFFGIKLDEGNLADLAGLPSLRRLKIDGSLPANAPNHGMNYVANCPRLDLLEIYDQQMTDEDIGPLASLSHLQLLRLRSSLTDKAIEVLVRLKTLKHLDIEWAKNLSDIAIRELVTQLPNLKTFAPPDILSIQTRQVLSDRKLPGFQ
jgi:hypothetical protein